MAKILCVIPARYASTRLPGKPLIKIAGQTLVERVWRRVTKSKVIDEIIVATDHQDIFAEVVRIGGNAIMTDKNHPSGTDRLAEVSDNMPGYDIIINVQGDEPLISAANIDSLAIVMRDAINLKMASMMTIMQQSELLDPAAVKVVVDLQSNALYFSRSLIPFPRKTVLALPVYKHIGIYAYRRDFLQEYAKWTPTLLEQCEGLEQLRALEHGVDIRMLYTDEVSVGVDTWDDLQLVEEMIVNGKS